MPPTEPPAWITSATSAAVRLAAEAGAEVDEILEHGAASPDHQAAQILRLQQSADATEVATDLACLLWAECEDVPPIETILGEPATQAALEAVGEARRQAGSRLADAAAKAAQQDDRQTLSSLRLWAAQAPPTGDDTSDTPPEPAAAITPVAEDRRTAPTAARLATAPRPGVPASRHPVTGAILAGAAAAILLFGRRIRRA